MPLANCKKCGKLFMKKNRDICDACYEAQNKLAEEICNYVISLEKDCVSMAHIMEKFNISSKEFENFFNNAKFVQINDILTVKCVRCGNEFKPGRKTGFICDNCLRKLKI